MLQGKTAIVTGGTRGIGLAIVRTFLKNGANVALFDGHVERVPFKLLWNVNAAGKVTHSFWYMED